MSPRSISKDQEHLNRFRTGPTLWPVSSPRSREDQDKLRERRDNLLQASPIDSLLQEYPDESAAVRSEVMSRLQSTVTTSGNGDPASAREEQLLNTFRNGDAESLVRRWTRRNYYRAFLAENYEESEVPLSSYDEEARRLRQKQLNDPNSFETFKHKILHDWESAREAKRQSLESKLVQEQDKQVLEEMNVRIAQFRNWAELLRPIRRYFASAWDLSGSTRHESDFDVFRRSEHILKQRRQVEAIADRLGRLDKAESEYARQRLKSFSKPQQLILDRAGKSSVVGIRESDDISAMISSEVVLLSSTETEDLFFLKFVEKKLLTYDYQPEMRSRATARPGSVRQKGTVDRRGPIILAIDTSGSMQGELERDAKAFALAIFRVAFRQHRSVHVITFSTAIDSIVLTPNQSDSLEQLIKFLSLSFRGGTDLSEALEEGVSMLEKPEFRQADMLFLTDGDAPPFGREQVKAMAKARQNGVRFYSLLVGNTANKRLLKQFDFNWRYQKFRLMEVAINLENFQRDRSTSNRS